MLPRFGPVTFHVLAAFGPCSVSMPGPPWTLNRTAPDDAGNQREDVVAVESVQVQRRQRRDAGQVVDREVSSFPPMPFTISVSVVPMSRREDADVGAVEFDPRAVGRDREHIDAGGAAVDLDGVGIGAAFIDIRAVAVAPDQHVRAGAAGKRVGAGTADDPVAPAPPVSVLAAMLPTRLSAAVPPVTFSTLVTLVAPVAAPVARLALPLEKS